jgi:RimJ/RimL family protein N-acetyltransferase
VDDWQGRGLGTELLSRLSDRARQAGIHRLTALAAAENVAVAGLARKLGARLAGRGPGTMEYEVALVPADYSLDWWFGCVNGPASDQAWRETRLGKAFPAGADVLGASRAWRGR